MKLLNAYANLTMPPLTELQADINVRVSVIRREQPAWPCCAGCDTCCKRLADVPQLTASEWALMRSGLETLTTEVLQNIRADIALFAQHAVRPIVCPLLDQPSGQCRVYAHRPIACRTYGFYVQRELGLYCKDIENRVAEGDYDTVVWGNQDAVEQRLKECGPARPLTEWFAEWPEAP